MSLRCCCGRSLNLDHRRDGCLAVYLFSRHSTTTNVYFVATVLNHANAEESLTKGDLSLVSWWELGWMSACVCEMRPRESHGWENMASISDIRNENSGFLSSTGFVIKIEIRLKLPENEAYSLSTDKNSGIYTVRIFFGKGSCLSGLSSGSSRIFMTWVLE